MLTAVTKLLENPFIFEAQQKFCNNYENVRTEFLEYLLKPGQDILDIGCSTGTCASKVIDMERQRYTGIDMVSGYVATASRRSSKGRFLTMDGRSLSFYDESFDLVMYIGVLHHMDDETAGACLRETRRVLRTNGHVLIAEPVFTRKKWLSSLLLSMDRGCHIRDEAGYRALFGRLRALRERHFSLSLHRFCFFVLARDERR